MSHQICPRCKFRLTSAKAICNTCGYALQTSRKPEPVSSTHTAPKPVYNNVSSSTASSSGANAASMRKAQAAQNSGGTGNFWRSFFGLDPMPADKVDRDEPALGET